MNKQLGRLGSNNIIKLFIFEVKRAFSDVFTIVLSCFVPIILIITIIGSVLPVLFQGAELNDIKVALYNQDLTFETRLIVNHLMKSDSVNEMVDVVDVSSLDEGKELIDNLEVSALIVIPENLQQNLYDGKSQTLSFYSGKTNKQITNLLFLMLNKGLDNINQGQKSVDIVYSAMRDMGYEREDASQKYSDMATFLFTNIISRSDIYSEYSEVSATGDYLNIEYYSISIFILCLFFSGLIISASANKDISMGILDRGSFYMHSFSYSLSKCLANAIYILVPVITTSLFILIISGSMGLFSGNIILLILTMMISSLYFSAIMIFIGSYTKTVTSSIWVGFSSALIICLISGMLVPRYLMPRFIINIAEITGLPSIIRLYSAALFGISSTTALIDITICIVIVLILFFLGHLRIRRYFFII